MIPQVLLPLARPIARKFPSVREYYLRKFYPRVYCRFFRIIGYYLPILYKMYWSGLKGKSIRQVITREDISNFSNEVEGVVSITDSDYRFKIPGTEVVHEDKGVSTEVSSIGAWVPYVKDKTSVSLFHFFSVNYALRRQVLIRITLIDDLEVKRQESFWLPAFYGYDFDLKKYFKGLSGNSVYVEMFHPKIDRNHASWYDLPGAHLRFWGKYYGEGGDFISTVHSVPHHHWVRFDHRDPWARAHFPDDAPGGECKHISITHSEPGEVRENFIGFNLITDGDGAPRAAWHKANSGPAPFELGSTSWKMKQAFWCPDLKDVDPVFFIDDVETSVSKQKIRIHLVKGLDVIQSKEVEVNGYFSATVSKIFGEKVKGPYCVICEYSVNHYAYLNFCYNTAERVGDGNHAQDCFWDVVDGKLVPQNIQSRGPALKFFHFQKANYSFKNLLVIHSHPVKGGKNHPLKVRIFTDNGKEFLKTIDMKQSSPFFVIDIKDVFLDIYDNIDATGVLQMETGVENYDSSVMHVNLENSNIAIEHTTGA